MRTYLERYELNLKSLLSGIIGACLLSACATTTTTYKAYSGPARKKQDVAILRSGVFTPIHSIDGEGVPQCDYYEILPGTHTVSASYDTWDAHDYAIGRQGGYHAWGFGPQGTSFFADAGYHYVTDAVTISNYPQGTWKLYVTRLEKAKSELNPPPSRTTATQEPPKNAYTPKLDPPPSRTTATPPHVAALDNEELRRKAKSGNAEAQMQLAQYLYTGKHGLSTNRVEAYKWASVSASRGNTAAQALVGEMDLFMTPEEVSAGKAAARPLLDNLKTTRDQETP